MFGINITTRWIIRIKIDRWIYEGKRAIGMLNSLMWSSNILAKTKKIIYKTIVESVMIYGAETWTLNREQEGKLRALNCTSCEDQLGSQGGIR